MSKSHRVLYNENLPPDVTLIFPAYNEADTIATTLAEAAACFDARNIRAEFIVAADGMDGTREIARKAIGGRAIVIGSPERRGKGRGVREAVRLAQGAVIGYADADNKVPATEYDKVAPLIAAADVVIGSRSLGRSVILRRQPLYRRLGSKGFYFFMQAVVGLPGVTDSQCGFKFFRHDAAKRIFSAQRVDGYMFDVEVLSLAHRLGYTIREVAIDWRDDGDSRLDLLSGNLRNVLDIFRIGLSRASS